MVDEDVGNVSLSTLLDVWQDRLVLDALAACPLLPLTTREIWDEIATGVDVDQSDNRAGWREVLIVLRRLEAKGLVERVVDADEVRWLLSAAEAEKARVRRAERRRGFH